MAMCLEAACQWFFVRKVVTTDFSTGNAVDAACDSDGQGTRNLMFGWHIAYLYMIRCMNIDLDTYSLAPKYLPSPSLTASIAPPPSR